ncbi:MAG: hypothetical protein R3D71_03405 [Rickettsiales bacterium]
MTRKKKKKYNTIYCKEPILSLRQYYHLAIWLPIVVPLLLWAIGMRPVNQELFQTGNSSTFFYLVVFGVIQYFIFACWSIFKYRGASALELKKVAFAAPIAFVPYYAFGFLIIYTIANFDLPGFPVFLVVILLSVVCLPVGYLYVGLSKIIQMILERTGVINQESFY